MNWTKADIGRMTSEQYKQALEIHGDDFRRAVDEADAQPTARRAGKNVRGADAPTPAGGFDPSFDDEPQTAPVAAVEQPVVVVPPVELPEQIHSYQPTDKNGKPVGGKQSFKYRTQDELIQKLSAAHSAASARIRELGRDRKLESIVAASKNLDVPDAPIPTTVGELASELVNTRQEAFLARVQMALTEFQATKEWEPYRSDESAQTLILAVQRSGDDPRDPASFRKAFATMKEHLVLNGKPVEEPIVEQPKAAAVVVPAAVIRHVAISTGLSSADSISSSFADAIPEPANVGGIVVSGTRITDIAQWDRVPADMQKKVLRNPANAKIIDALYDLQAEKIVARRAR